MGGSSDFHHVRGWGKEQGSSSVTPIWSPHETTISANEAAVVESKEGRLRQREELETQRGVGCNPSWFHGWSEWREFRRKCHLAAQDAVEVSHDLTVTQPWNETKQPTNHRNILASLKPLHHYWPETCTIHRKAALTIHVTYLRHWPLWFRRWLRQFTWFNRLVFTSS